MPKLDKASVDEYWQIKGPNMSTMISHIQSGENWTHENDPAFIESANSLGQLLDHIPDGFLSTMATSKEAVDKIRYMLAAMPASMRLRLLSWLAEERTDGSVLAANILSPNGDDENAINSGKVVRDSLRHLARQDLICKIFSTSRLKTIREAIERS